MKSSIFIGSSVEGLEVAYALQANLEHQAEVTVWSQGVFGLTKATLASLIQALSSFDFAVLILSADDSAQIRDQHYSVARDNVIFELGMFIGSLGTDRTFFVVPRDTPDLHLPSDLAGISPGTYEANRRDGNIQAALGPTSHAIAKALTKLGPCGQKQSHASKLKAQTDTSKPNRAIVAQSLRDFVSDAEEVWKKVVIKEITHEDAEPTLVRWKIKVCRFLDKNFGVGDAKSFMGLRTSHGASTGEQHFKSAYQSHISFLEILAGEVEDDPTYPLVEPPTPSGKLSFANLRFTYASN